MSPGIRPWDGLYGHKLARYARTRGMVSQRRGGGLEWAQDGQPIVTYMGMLFGWPCWAAPAIPYRDDQPSFLGYQNLSRSWEGALVAHLDYTVGDRGPDQPNQPT